MSAVFKRELRSYFNSMTGWIFLAVIFVFTGVFTTAINLLSQSASFEYVLSQITIVFMLIVPILAMRSIAEERRSRTDQLLYSLSMVAVLFISCVAMGFVPVLLSLYGNVRYASCYAALLGFFLLGSALIAICMFMSSLTESQIIAAVTGFGVVLALYLMNGLSSLIPTSALGSPPPSA